eukprot:gene11059-biopygen3097
MGQIGPFPSQFDRNISNYTQESAKRFARFRKVPQSSARAVRNGVEPCGTVPNYVKYPRTSSKMVQKSNMAYQNICWRSETFSSKTRGRLLHEGVLGNCDENDERKHQKR